MFLFMFTKLYVGPINLDKLFVIEIKYDLPTQLQ